MLRAIHRMISAKYSLELMLTTSDEEPAVLFSMPLPFNKVRRMLSRHRNGFTVLHPLKPEVGYLTFKPYGIIEQKNKEFSIRFKYQSTFLSKPPRQILLTDLLLLR